MVAADSMTDISPCVLKIQKYVKLDVFFPIQSYISFIINKYGVNCKSSLSFNFH